MEKSKDIIQMNDLVAEAKAGSPEAFCELYGMFKDRLYRFALYRLRDPHAAEDAVSETVLAAWKNIGSLKSAEAFGGWIYAILSNKCVEVIRKDIRQRENLEAVYEASASASGSDPSLSVELREALDILDEENRQIVLLSVVAGLSSREISEITGIGNATVRSKLARSLGRMREFLS